MAPIATALQSSSDLRVLNLDHPTRRLGIGDLVEHVDVASRAWRTATPGAIHLVGHSLGGLVARAWIKRHRPERLGRVVLLGPPTRGSEIADLLASTGLYRLVFGPAGAELTTDWHARADLLGRPDYPLGIIAGNRALDPFGWAWLPKPNDGKVSVARTHVDGETAHLILPVTHTFMMRDPAVIAATRRFLLDGRFV